MILLNIKQSSGENCMAVPVDKDYAAKTDAFVECYVLGRNSGDFAKAHILRSNIVAEYEGDDYDRLAMARAYTLGLINTKCS